MRSPALLFALAVLLTGCPPTKVKAPPTPPPDSDWCDDMCYWIGPDHLNCEEGQKVYNSDLPGPDGVPNQECVDWCHELQDPEHLYFVNPKCVSEVTSCSQIEEARKRDYTTCAGKPMPEPAVAP